MYYLHLFCRCINIKNYNTYQLLKVNIFKIKILLQEIIILGLLFEKRNIWFKIKVRGNLKINYFLN